MTEQGLSFLRKLADKQENQRAIKNMNRTLKQTRDKKLAENPPSSTKI